MMHTGPKHSPMAGFTLIETIMVLFVVGILVGTIFGVVQFISQRTKTTETAETIRLLSSNVRDYFTSAPEFSTYYDPGAANTDAKITRYFNVASLGQLLADSGIVPKALRCNAPNGASLVCTNPLGEDTTLSFNTTTTPTSLVVAFSDLKRNQCIALMTELLSNKSIDTLRLTAISPALTLRSIEPDDIRDTVCPAANPNPRLTIAIKSPNPL